MAFRVAYDLAYDLKDFGSDDSYSQAAGGVNVSIYLSDATGTGEVGNLVSVLPPAFDLAFPYVAATDTSLADGGNAQLNLSFDNGFVPDSFVFYDSGPGVTGNYIISNDKGESITVEGHQVTSSLGGSKVSLPGWHYVDDITIKYCGD